MKRVRTKESYEELRLYKLRKAMVFKACLVGFIPIGNRPKPRYEYTEDIKLDNKE